MKFDILICSVGGQEVKPYLDFFFKLATKVREHINVDYEKGFSKERCSERYSVHIGSGFGDILEGRADAVLCLEQLEAVKNRFYPKEEGGLIVSKKRILPASVISGVSEYPTDCLQKCVNDCFKVFESEDTDYLKDCFLCLRLLGFREKEALDLFKDEFENAEVLVKEAFAQKFVKA